MLDIINFKKKEFCGFPLCFHLLTYGEENLFHLDIITGFDACNCI